MLRKIIHIDEEKCDGCGLCVPACEEGAIAVIDGKARLVGEIYCDGLGACLGECPQGAIRMEEREAEKYDEAATHAHLARRKAVPAAPADAGGCPGIRARVLEPSQPRQDAEPTATPSQLRTWPVQLALVSPAAPYLRDADLLLVADCVPFAYADFHRDYLRGKPVLIACPKLDNVAPYVGKLAAIFQQARPRSLTVLHMEVPCCMGIVRMAEEAIAKAGVNLPLAATIIGIGGETVPAGRGRR